MQKRYILMLMLLLMINFHSWVDMNLNVAIISMVRPLSQKVSKESKPSSFAICPNETFFWREQDHTSMTEMPVSQEETYEWNDYEKRMVLSAYHWLKWLAILPGSVLSQKYGSKVVSGYSLCTSALLSSLIPFAATYGAKGVMYIRVIQGIISFFSFPGGTLNIIGNWSSKNDRGKFAAVFLVGISLGHCSGGYLFGYIGHYSHWKYIFYLTSLCGLVWTVLWYFLVYDFPASHPTISIEEKNAILNNNMSCNITDENIPTPWKDILTSIPIYACYLLQQGIVCAFWIFVIFAPLYLRDMFGLDSNQIGIILSFPLLICAIISVIFAWFSDYVVEKQWLSVTNTRKLFACPSMFLSSVALIVIALIKCNLLVSISCIILGNILRTISAIGLIPTIVDLSPKFCGIIEGFEATLLEIVIFAFVTGLSQLTHVLPTPEYWQVVFLTTGIIGIVTSVIFLIWGSAETQPWNQGSKKVVPETDK